jgi:hypothetical protein
VNPVAFGSAVIFQACGLSLQVGSMLMGRNPRVDGNQSFWLLLGSLVFLCHHNGSRRQLVALDLPVLPPAKSGAIGDAHGPGILAQFHGSMMTYLPLLSINIIIFKD